LKEENSGCGLKTEVMDTGIRHADYARFLYLQKLALTSPTSGGRSAGILCSRTQGKEFVLVPKMETMIFLNLHLNSVMLATILLWPLE
jgi:hypothetical protein